MGVGQLKDSVRQTQQHSCEYQSNVRYFVRYFKLLKKKNHYSTNGV